LPARWGGLFKVHPSVDLAEPVMPRRRRRVKLPPIPRGLLPSGLPGRPLSPENFEQKLRADLRRRGHKAAARGEPWTPGRFLEEEGKLRLRLVEYEDRFNTWQEKVEEEKAEREIEAKLKAKQEKERKARKRAGFKGRRWPAPMRRLAARLGGTAGLREAVERLGAERVARVAKLADAAIREQRRKRKAADKRWRKSLLRRGFSPQEAARAIQAGRALRPRPEPKVEYEEDQKVWIVTDPVTGKKHHYNLKEYARWSRRRAVVEEISRLAEVLHSDRKTAAAVRHAVYAEAQARFRARRKFLRKAIKLAKTPSQKRKWRRQLKRLKLRGYHWQAKIDLASLSKEGPSPELVARIEVLESQLKTELDPAKRALLADTIEKLKELADADDE